MALPHKQHSAMLALLLAADTFGSLQAGDVMLDLPRNDRAYWVAVAAACRSPTPARRPTMALPHKQHSAMLALLPAADAFLLLQAGDVMPDLPRDDRAYWVAVAAACRSLHLPGDPPWHCLRNSPQQCWHFCRLLTPLAPRRQVL